MLADLPRAFLLPLHSHLDLTNADRELLLLRLVLRGRIDIEGRFRDLLDAKTHQACALHLGAQAPEGVIGRADLDDPYMALPTHLQGAMVGWIETDAGARVGLSAAIQCANPSSDLRFTPILIRMSERISEVLHLLCIDDVMTAEHEALPGRTAQGLLRLDAELCLVGWAMREGLVPAMNFHDLTRSLAA